MRLGVLVLSYLWLMAGAAKIAIPGKLYQCSERGSCELQPRAGEGVSQEQCLVTCGKGMLWPYPSGDVKIASDIYTFDLTTLSYQINCEGHANELMDAMFDVFHGTLNRTLQSTRHPAEKTSLSIDINVVNCDATSPRIGMDESYSLSGVTGDQHTVYISASTLFGARHALETLSQLIFPTSARMPAVPASYSIADSPAFAYRGVMLDVSRHFLPISDIITTLNSMAYNKLNVLHLHLSDTASFPVETPSQPNITSYGAYSALEVYTVEDLSHIASQALIRGIVILPEIDSPAHMGAGWEWGDEAGIGDLVLCGDALGHEKSAWTSRSLEPPSGQLNLANPRAYEVLEDVLRDVIDVFHSSVFHIGGDEVIVGSDEAWAACYNSSTLGAPIVAMLESLGLDRDDPQSFYFMWETYTQKVTSMVQKIYKDGHLQKLHIWGGGGDDPSGVTYNLMTRPDVTTVLPPDLFTIEVWDTSDESISKKLIDQGYDIVLANTDYVYLDCGNAGFTNPGGYWCQPYHEWFHIYDYINDVVSKWNLSPDQVRHIAGSETLIWGEMIDGSNVHQKLWPRAAALAEALWTRPSSDWYAADPRMQQWRHTLVRRGVPAEALQPQWCQQRGAYACTLDAGTPQ